MLECICKLAGSGLSVAVTGVHESCQRHAGGIQMRMVRLLVRMLVLSLA